MIHLNRLVKAAASTSLPILILAYAALVGCDTLPSAQSVARLHVVATTSIIGNVVSNVAGDLVNLTVLMNAGQDPHGYEPSASDIAQLEQADLIFSNGLGFEQNLLPILNSLADQSKVVEVSESVEVVQTSEGDQPQGDPHVWQDPNNVLIWISNIEIALSQADPDHASDFHTRAAAYRAQLRTLDQDISLQVQNVPAQKRKLVTNHNTFGYFAKRYGFEVIGIIFASGPESEPTAGDLAALIDVLRQTKIPAIFVENTLNPQQAEVIASEVGYPIKVVTLYTDALGAPGSGADTYIGMITTNVNAIVEALAQ